jgi:transposase
MPSIHAKTSRGHKYWYIVESRRVNGKPRPIVLAYLGKAEDLLKRLAGLTQGLRLKSYSHGAVAALLQVAGALDVAACINRHIRAHRSYMADQPIRNHLTAGITFVLGAIGRVCMPTSKRGWWNWAKTTSCEYLLRCSLRRVDSQHFWDLMDALPLEAIAKIEQELVREALARYALESGTLFFDTTNFFTYIASTNHRCTIAQRGKNKQKRYDLRQTGLALVVTQEDMIPVFHLTYQGNLNDTKVFAQVLGAVKQRILDLGMELETHTFVFDRGNNSKKNLALVHEQQLHYIGALTPYHHQALIQEAEAKFQEIDVPGGPQHVYRDQRSIWGQERTVIVFISDRLKAGQLRGLYQALAKAEAGLQELQSELANPRARKRDRNKLEKKIESLTDQQYVKDVMHTCLEEISEGKFRLSFSVREKALEEIENRFGFRILMTDRHRWDTADIIQSYHGQSKIEQAFKNIKNPYHLALKPQFHWTDQKIIAHHFMCVLGYLLAALVWREARRKAQFRGTLDSLLDTLNNIRLGTILEQPSGKGRPKATYKLEDLSKEEEKLLNALEIQDLHRTRPKLKGVGVYA